MNLKITGFADEISQNLTAQIDGLKYLGMSYVEMRGVDGSNIIYHTNEKVKEIKKVLDDNGIRVSALGSPLGKIGILDDFDKHFEEFKRAVEIGHMLECENIRVFSFYLPYGRNPKEFEGAVFERIGRFINYAKANDVVLLHENDKGVFGEKVEECKNLLDVFYGNNFKAIFDFANFVQCHEDSLKAYKILKRYINYFHVKDAKVIDGSIVPAGCGDGNVVFIVKDMLDNNYDGFFSIEPHLFDFIGLWQSEKDEIILQNYKQNIISGLDMFTFAYDSLMKIISSYCKNSL